MMHPLPVTTAPTTTDRLAVLLDVDAGELRRLAARERLDLERLAAGDVDRAERLCRYLIAGGAMR